MDKASSPVEWAIEMLDEAETVEAIRLILKGSARAGVQSQGATVVELDGDQCHYVDEDAMSPLWKGQRFPVASCISGWSMLHHQTVIIHDIRADSRIPQEAYRPTFVRSLVAVPIHAGHAMGAVGVYWGDLHRASDDEVSTIERLADAAGRALKRVAEFDATTTSAPMAGAAAA